MGIVQRKDFLYLSVSCGKLKNKKKGIETGGYEGYIQNIVEKEDEYEGKPVTKIEVKMKDNNSDQFAIIQWTKESWYSMGFFARIRKIDVAKPFTIGVQPSERNEKMSFCYLKQEGIVKVEADKNFPKPKVVKVSSKDVTDWTEPMEEFKKIMDELNAKIVPVPEPKSAETATAATETTPAANGGGETDDLPF